VDAALTYAPASLRMAREGARPLARWENPAEPELLVLVATDRAHRVAAGQLAQLAQAWYAGARMLLRPDTAATALIARREEIEPGEVGDELETQRYFDAAKDRRLRQPEGLPIVEAALSTIASRWRSLGVTDTLPPLGHWLAPPGRPS
jgi:hypothetical protein